MARPSSRLSKLPTSRPFWVIHVPTKNFNSGAMDFVVFGNAHGITIHESLGCGEEDTNIGTDFAGFGHASGKVTSQEGGLVDFGCVTENVGLSEVINIHNGEFLIGVGISCCTGCICQQETNRDDQITTCFNECVQIDFIV